MIKKAITLTAVAGILLSTACTKTEVVPVKTTAPNAMTNSMYNAAKYNTNGTRYTTYGPVKDYTVKYDSNGNAYSNANNKMANSINSVVDNNKTGSKYSMKNGTIYNADGTINKGYGVYDNYNYTNAKRFIKPTTAPITVPTTVPIVTSTPTPIQTPVPVQTSYPYINGANDVFDNTMYTNDYNNGGYVVDANGNVVVKGRAYNKNTKDTVLESVKVPANNTYQLLQS